MKTLPIILAALAAGALTVSAQTTYLWTNLVTGNASGSWGTAAAWNPAGPANGTDNTAQFTLPLTNGASTIALDGNRTIGNLFFGNTSASNLSWTVNAGTPTTSLLNLSVSSGTPTIAVTNQTATFGMPVVSTQGIIKTGGGTLLLNNTNNFGVVSNSVAAGALQLGSLTALPANSQVGVSSGASLRADLAGTYNSITSTITGGGISGQSGPGALWFRGGGTTTVTWPGQILLNGNSTIGSFGVNYNVTLGGVISGTGNLSITPVGGSPASHTAIFNLSKQNTYDGATTFGNGGGLLTTKWNLGTNNVLPTTTSLSVNSSISAGSSVILDLAGYNQTLAKLTMNGSAATVTESLTNSSATIPTLNLNTNSGTAFQVSGGTNYLSNLILNIGGSGETATAIGIGAATVLNVSNVIWNSSTLMDLGRSAATVINLYNGTALTNSGSELLLGHGNSAAVTTLNVNTGAVVTAHYIRVGTTAASTLNLNAGSVVTVNQIYANSTNTVNWNGALVQPNAAPNTPWFAATLTNVQVQAGGAVINTAGKNPVIAAALLAGSPSGGLTKSGVGTLTLSGANNTYTGSTVVSNGTLAVDGNLLASPVTLATVAGAMPALSGNGFVPAATINAGTYLNPGRTNLAGTLTVSNLTTAAGGTLSFDLSNSGATIGGGVNDLLVTTNVTLAATTTVGLNFLAGYPGTADRYVLATYSGSASGLANLALDPALVSTRAAIGLDTATAGEIAVRLTNGLAPANLTWYGNNPNNNWDQTSVLNWNVGGDQFFNADNVVFDDSAQTTTVNLVGSLYPATVTFNNSGTYTLTGSGQIGGATALTLNGGGTIIISGNSLNHSGGAILNGGNTLQLGNANAAGTLGTGDVQFLNSASTLAYNRTDALTLNNRIYGSSGVEPLIQVNSGALTLAGAADNSFATATVSSGGTLVLAKTSTSAIHALGGGGTALTINTGGTAKLGGTGGDQIFDTKDVQNDGALDLAGLNETINNLVGSGIVSNSAVGNSVLSVGSDGAVITFNGEIKNGSGTVGLTKLGGGSMTVATTNTATGPLSIVGNGYVYLNNASGQAWAGPVTFTNNTGNTPRLVLQASEQIGNSSIVSFGGNGAERRFQLNGFNETIGGVNDRPGVSGNRIVEAANDNVADLPATLTLNVGAGITNSTGAYVRDAAGGANSILTLVKTGAGTQTFSGSAGLVNISGPTTVSNGVLELSGGSVLANSAVTLAGGTLNISGGGTRTTAVAGTGTLQVGGSTFITTATNTYTGNTWISAGTLQLGDGTSNGSILTDVTNNGTFKISVATNTVQTYAGVVSGTGSFTKDAFGTLYLNGVNTFAGNVTVNAGALWINNSQGLGLGAKTVNLANGTAGHPELHLNGTNGNIILAATSSFSTSWAGTPAIQNEAGNNVINGTINLTAGGGDTYLAVNGGTLTLAGGISASSANRNLLLGGAASGTVSGVISNGTQVLNSLRKVDAGTWTLSGANTFTGPTTVEAGTLLVNGSLNTNSLTVFTNATLGGSGTLLGTVTVQDGGTLAPGTSIGTLTISNNLTLGALSTNVFEVSAATGTNDHVRGLATVTYGGKLVVTNVAGTFTTPVSFKLFAAATYNATPFASVQLPALTGALAWTNKLAIDGTIAVISTASVATNQVPITFSVTGGSLNLSWPPDHLGWSLQAQTNTLATGLRTNWVTVPGSAAVTNLSIPINVLNGSVFYRLVYP